MKFMRNLESVFGGYIEGFFDKKFASNLQPVEIAKALLHAMEREKSIGVSQLYVPNHYSIYINRNDYVRMVPYGQAIRDELAVYISTECEKRGYTIVGKPIIDLFVDEKNKRVRFWVECDYTEPIPLDEDQPEEFSDTRVFEKISFSEQSNTVSSATLTVVEGIDKELSLTVGKNRINIGRRESNELPLSDMNASRLHAYIVPEEDFYVIYDAQSLNGTYVNNQRITRKKLNSGDKIRVGNTVILYEVKK